MTINRRGMLKLTGAAVAASTAGVAGCLDDVGLDGDGDGEPDYAQWIAAGGSEDDAFFIYADWATLTELDELDEDDPEEDLEGNEDDIEADPMLGLPFVGLFGVAFAGFNLMGTGLEGLLIEQEDIDDADADDTDDAGEFDVEMAPERTKADYDSSVSELLLLDGGTVFTGEFDVDEIDEILTDEPEDMFSVQFEQSETVAGYEVYTPAGEGEGAMGMDERAIAVGDDAIAFATDDDPVDALRTPLEAKDGDGERAVDESDDFAWLVETAGHGLLAIGGYGEGGEEIDEGEIEEGVDDMYTGLDEAKGVVSSTTFDEDGSVEGSFAAIFDELDDDTESELEETLGSSADDVSIDVDGDRVSATATWDDLDD